MFLILLSFQYDTHKRSLLHPNKLEDLTIIAENREAVEKFAKNLDESKRDVSVLTKPKLEFGDALSSEIFGDEEDFNQEEDSSDDEES